MNIIYVIGLSFVVIAIGAILISFYFKKKEEFYERIQRKIEEQDSGSGSEQG